MGFALSVLSIGSLFSGFLLKDAFVGIGSSFWGNSIYKQDIHTIGLDFEFIPLVAKNLPLFLSIFGIILGMTLNKWLNLYQTKLNTNNYKTHLKVSYPQTYVTSV